MQPPLQIGPYRVTGILGQGGMGVVYRAEHDETGQAVAIKTVTAAGAAFLSCIRREIHALSRVEHPGVVRILGQGVDAGLPWYAMELLSGKTLSSYIRDVWRAPDPMAGTQRFDAAGPTKIDASAGSPDRAHPVPGHVRRANIGSLLEMIRRMCEPLAYLHGCGLVHRDLKPDNVFIQDDGSPVLVDLGIAASFSGAAGREQIAAEGLVMGTSWYMAPEQFRGEFVDARADLYALGCILYECIVGRPPFLGGMLAIQAGHLMEEPLSPSVFWPEIPAALEQLVLALLSKRPRDRLGYAVDVAAALEAITGPAHRANRSPAASMYLYRPELAGRSDVILEFEAALEQLASRRRGSCVFVGGESGVGKTRLAMEIARNANLLGVSVVTGQCVAIGADDASSDARVSAAQLHPLRPALLAISDYCRENPPDVTETIFGHRGAVLARYEPSIAELRYPRPHPEPEPLPSEAARARTFSYLKETLLAYCRVRPLLLILDDLQWADELTLAFLAELDGDELRARGLLLIGTYRMEELSVGLARVRDALAAHNLELGRLDRGSVRAMVSGMLALGEPPEQLLDFLTDASDGNPFFIAEYLQAAIGEQILTRDGAGRWRFLPPAADASLEQSIQVPESLSQLIHRRLTRLGPLERSLTVSASVLGRTFDSDVLLAMAAIEERDAFDAIATLRQRQILEDDSRGRLRFVHDKIRESAYLTAGDERRELHGRAAAAIEQHYPDEPSMYQVRGYHWSRAQAHDRALDCFERAAELAREAYANNEAARLYRSALDEARAYGSAQPERVARLEAGLGDMLALIGQQDEARVTYERALARTPAADRVGRAYLFRKLGKSWETHHQHERALKAYDRAEAALGEAPDLEADHWWQTWVHIQNDRIYVHYWLGHVDKMAQLVGAVRPVVEQRGTPLQRAHFFDQLVHLELREQRYMPTAELVGHARDAVRAAMDSGDVAVIANARLVLAFALLFHAVLEPARDEMIAAQALAERIGDVTLQSRCLTYLAFVYRRLGLVDETEAAVRRALPVAEAGKMVDYVGAAKANAGWVAWRRQDLDAARSAVREAVRLWEQLASNYPYPLQWTGLLLMIAIELADGQLDRAVSCAVELLDGKQARLDDAVTGELSAAVEAWRGDRPEDARRDLERAVSAARAYGYL